MSKEYRWGIQDLKIAKSADGLTNVIKKVYYRRSLKQIVNDIQHDVHYFGEFKLAPANPTSFTEYQNLTQEQIFTWLDAILPVDFINSRLDDYMAKKLEKDELEAFQLPNRLVTEEVDPTKLPTIPGGQIGE
jgi:hypothetical protein